MSKKPTDKFSFGGNFNVGGTPAGENVEDITVSPLDKNLQMVWQL
jgi:hypothetical protein